MQPWATMRTPPLTRTIPEAPPAMQPQGMQRRGMQSPAMQPQGMQPPAMQPQGMQPPAMQPRGMQPQAMQPQGMQPRGMQGIQRQSVRTQAIPSQPTRQLTTRCMDGRRAVTRPKIPRATTLPHTRRAAGTMRHKRLRLMANIVPRAQDSTPNTPRRSVRKVTLTPATPCLSPHRLRSPRRERALRYAA